MFTTPSPNHWKNQHLPKQDAAFIPINPKIETMRVGADDKAEVLLVDSNFRVIAACDDQGLLGECVPVSKDIRLTGFYYDRSRSLARFHARR